MFLFVSKKKLMKVLHELESDAADQRKVTGGTPEARRFNQFWRTGNAHAVDYIKLKLKLR